MVQPIDPIYDPWLMAGPRQVTLAKACGESRLLAWNEMPADPESVIALKLAPDRPSIRVPRAVASLTALRRLLLPVRMASHLRSGDLPTTLTQLYFVGSTQVLIAKRAVFPFVQSVRSERLCFEPSAFPHITELAVDLKSNTKMFKVLSSLATLEGLSVGHATDHSAFERIRDLRLISLRLWQGPLTTLSGLEHLQTLQDLQLVGLQSLADIDAVTLLPNLRRVLISYCPALQDVSGLTRISNLKEASIVESGDPRELEIGAAVKARAATAERKGDSPSTAA